MRNMDPKEFLQKEYNDNLHYNYWISASLSHGQHDAVSQFLEKVPNTDEKGNYMVQVL